MRMVAIGLTAALLLSGVGQAVAAKPVKAAAAKPAAVFASDRIQVTTVGRGPDVILIPGLSSSPERAWRSTVEAVPGYRYHLVQVKGFAGVPAEANASGPVAAPVAAEIARYIREMKLKRPAVVGHSMGGTIGMMMAARQPDAVGRLMIVDMAPFLGAFFGQPNATPESLKPMAEQIRAGMSGPSTPQGEAMLEMTINGMVNTVPARAAILADSRASDRAATANAYYELVTTDLRPELGRIKAPTTVLFVDRPDHRQPASPRFQRDGRLLPTARFRGRVQGRGLDDLGARCAGAGILSTSRPEPARLLVQCLRAGREFRRALWRLGLGRLIEPRHPAPTSSGADRARAAHVRTCRFERQPLALPSGELSARA